MSNDKVECFIKQDNYNGKKEFKLDTHANICGCTN